MRLGDEKLGDFWTSGLSDLSTQWSSDDACRSYLLFQSFMPFHDDPLDCQIQAIQPKPS